MSLEYYITRWNYFVDRWLTPLTVHTLTLVRFIVQQIWSF